MKFLALILLMTISFGTIASSQTKTFFFDGSQESVNLSLQAEETHTEYRWEQVRTICYRQEVYYHTYCSQTPDGHRVCRTVPRYRTVSYPCIQTVSVPYEVKDYDVIANVDLAITNSSTLTPGETFKLTLDEDRLSLSGSSGSKKFFLLLKGEKRSTSTNGTLKTIDASYAVELVEAAPILKALDLTNISFQENILSLKLGPVTASESIGFHLTVKKAPLLGADTVLFNRELQTSEIKITTQNESSEANVNIQTLGLELKKGRHKIKTRVFYKSSGKIINSTEFDRIESSQTLVFKNRL
jgi:hypothetical protein